MYAKIKNHSIVLVYLLLVSVYPFSVLPLDQSLFVQSIHNENCGGWFSVFCSTPDARPKNKKVRVGVDNAYETVHTRLHRSYINFARLVVVLGILQNGKHSARQFTSNHITFSRHEARRDKHWKLIRTTRITFRTARTNKIPNTIRFQFRFDPFGARHLVKLISKVSFSTDCVCVCARSNIKCEQNTYTGKAILYFRHNYS